MKVKKGGSGSSSGSGSGNGNGNTTQSDSSMSSSIIIVLIVVLIIVSIIAIYFWLSTGLSSNGLMTMGNPTIKQNVTIQNQQPFLDDFYNVYIPPLRNNPYLIPFSTNGGGTTGFTQVGILKYDDSQFLPLFGRPLSTRRDLWQYYTVSNTGTIPGIKLAIKNDRGRDLMDDTGAPELYNDDTVIADGYDKPMQVSIYKQKQLYYV
jgi:hypothetical protein